MNYYPSNNQHMYPDPHYSFPVPNPTNRYIYVKHNFMNTLQPPKPKVLVNPHFRKKVFVNPQFKPPPAPIKPKIHVNPNILKMATNPPPKIAPQSVTVISTRNKLVRIPSTSSTVSVSPKKRRNSLHTKYKIVRSNSTPKTSTINKFKIDKRDKKTIIKSAKKKYVYVNRFLSMEVMAKNVLLKKNSKLCKKGFVNINGILYKKSPNSLKKATDGAVNKSPKTINIQSRYKLVRKEIKSKVNSTNTRRSIVKQFKLIRSKKSLTVKPSPNKLRKCNIPCPIFRKYGKCPGKVAGTCFKLHNPDQIVLCTRFLQGACRKENCLLSHKVSLEKMPTCKYYLEGLCSKDNCQYLHVKISPKAEICRDFLEGFCKKGAECNKRHQFLCPEYEKNKDCKKRKCPYPHGNVVRKTKVINISAKKCSAKAKKNEKEVSEINRYYNDLVLSKNEDVITVTRERPKLGDLPAFIPFFEGT